MIVGWLCALAAMCGSASAATLHLVVALKPRDPSGLAAFARAVSTPGTPQYRRYLTVGQFARRYGASPRVIRAVKGAVVRAGLRVDGVTANHLSLSVSGRRSRHGRAEAAMASFGPGIEAVVGFNNHRLASAAAPAVHDQLAAGEGGSHASGPQPCSTQLAAQSSYTQMGRTVYTAPQIASAYDFGPLYAEGATGAGQTVAIVGLSPFSTSDVSTYQQCYGLGNHITTVDVGAGAPTGTGSEVELDTEQVAALAPQANIEIYQAPDSEQGLLSALQKIVSQDNAKVISASYDECEFFAAQISGLLSAENTALMEAASQGQTFFADTGDTGSAGCFSSSTSHTELSVDDPASQPFATGVGGTTLQLTPVSPSESVWNDGEPAANVPEASGGGISAQQRMPGYQSSAPASLGVINTRSSAVPCAAPTGDCREVPDVSADADPNTGYLLYVGGSWTHEGGTSAATPFWAAFTALTNSSPPCRGSSVGFVNPALYQIAGSAYAQNFRDVSQPSAITHLANNDALGSNGGSYPVTPGYDMATGLGAPIGATLARSLCAPESPINTITFRAPGNQQSAIGQAVSLPVTATDSRAGEPLSYSAIGLPAGLAVNASTGAITGSPTKVATYAVTITAQDADFNTASTAFTWTVSPARPVLSTASLTGILSGHPRLRFKLASTADMSLVLVNAPNGFTFATAAKTLKRGVSASPHAKLGVRRNTLNLTFAPVAAHVSVSISSPALVVSRTAAARIRAHKKQPLRFSFDVIDPNSDLTTLVVRLRPS
jgi:kumamolisin